MTRSSDAIQAHMQQKVFTKAAAIELRYYSALRHDIGRWYAAGAGLQVRLWATRFDADPLLRHTKRAQSEVRGHFARSATSLLLWRVLCAYDGRTLCGACKFRGTAHLRVLQGTLLCAAVHAQRDA